MIGRGPNVQVRTLKLQEQVQAHIDSLLPRLHYRPLLLPKSKSINIDPQTFEILRATHAVLNSSNLCWLIVAYVLLYAPSGVPAKRL